MLLLDGMKECFENTDLAERLARVPDDAACRGVFLNMLDERAGQFGSATQRAYREFFTLYRFSSLRLYPIKDYITRVVKLAQIEFGAPNIYRGIAEIQAGAFLAWRRTLLGRTWFAVLGSDFESVLRLVARTMSKVVNYGNVSLHAAGSGQQLTMQFVDQYVYIEHAMKGAIQGVARACGVVVELDVRLEDMFNGSIGISVQRVTAGVPVGT
jgi:uncharacterized protein (TIGR02265 family)